MYIFATLKIIEKRTINVNSIFSLRTLVGGLLCFLCSLAVSSGLAQEHTLNESEQVEEKERIDQVILHHVLDDHQWHISDHVIIPLPIIVYSSERGLESFLSSHFFDHHKPVEYNGYKLDHQRIYLVESGNQVFDLSITKNVMMLLITAAIVLFCMLAVAKLAQARKGKVPKGIQAWVEPIIIFVRDEVVKPCVGPRYETYLPYILSLFFFIFVGNILGLLPGAGNLTGNISVTMTLAVLTFIITNVSGNKAYWTHIFWTPGIPLLLRIVFLPVEMIGVFTKPFALMIRLFVAITAGHIVILSLISLAFIFGSIWIGLGTSVIVLFINLIELLVAGIQAYVFALFTSLYIGMAIEDHGHEKADH